MKDRRPLVVSRLGTVGFEEAWDLQREMVRRRKAGEIEDRLLLLEHRSVYTFGRRGDLGHVRIGEARRRELGIELVHTDRGGDVTWHGPGQLVGYPILDLAPDRKDVARYVRDLEEAILRTMADFGVAGERVKGLTGVWAGKEKVAAIGVRISRWVTSHGFAFNVCCDLDAYGHIVPCGISDRGVTTLSRLAGRPIAVDEAADRLTERFAEVFDRAAREETHHG
ncbi:MAG: lipoyl(octanoyl) transferase LipB [Candidatus Eisenbacteria bacterium]|nr:lipoyl(octanoyl) transferase LipB [Candidatus Eisenbacteria bacterium]